MNHKRKCCGCPPKAGTSILLLWTMVWCIVGMYVVNYKTEELRRMIGLWDELFLNNFYRCFVINLFIIVAIVCIVGFYGVYSKKPGLLMPYIVYRTVVDILIAIGLFPLLLDLCLDPSKYGIDKSFRTPFVDAQDSSDYIFVLFIVLEFLFIAIQVHFIKVILSCYDLMESSSKTCKNEILALSNLKGSSPNGKFYFTCEKEISTAV